MDLYTHIKYITRNEFIEKWEYSEKLRRNPDPSALERIEHHRAAHNKYSLIELREESLERIILPLHNADHHFYKVTRKYNSLLEFSNEFSWDSINKDPKNECLESVWYQIQKFNEQISSQNPFLERDFIYVSPNSELAIKDQETKEDYLFAGGFHQFAAYALFTKRNGFYPLRAFLCEYTT